MLFFSCSVSAKFNFALERFGKPIQTRYIYTNTMIYVLLTEDFAPTSSKFPLNRALGRVKEIIDFANLKTVRAKSLKLPI